MVFRSKPRSAAAHPAGIATSGGTELRGRPTALSGIAKYVEGTGGVLAGSRLTQRLEIKDVEAQRPYFYSAAI